MQIEYHLPQIVVILIFYYFKVNYVTFQTSAWSKELCLKYFKDPHPREHTLFQNTQKLPLRKVIVKCGEPMFSACTTSQDRCEE